MSKRRKSTPRTPNRFRFRELIRAVRAAKAAGGERVEVDPTTGKITVIVGGKLASTSDTREETAPHTPAFIEELKRPDPPQ